MEAHDRKVQKKGTSGFFVAIPSPIVHALGIEKGRTVRFWAVNGKAVFKPVSADGLTKKDVADVDKYEEAVRGIREELKAGTIGRPGGRGKRPENRQPATTEPDHPGQEAVRPGSGQGNRPLSNAERLKRLSI